MGIFLLNFKKEFAPRVESGEKRQTIRRNRRDGRRPQTGDTVKCYTGLRTRAARLLRVAPVTECLSVRMDIDERVVVVDGRLLNRDEAHAFARADGFESLSWMFFWFRDQYHSQVFEGFCVRWEVTA